MSRTPLLALVVACIALEASPAPANVTSAVNSNEEPTHESGAKLETNQKSLSFDESSANFGTHNILEKIRSINDGLTKPEKRVIKSNNRPQSGAEYVIDEATFDKIQEIIAAIKPKHFSQQSNKYQNINSISNDDDMSQRYSKALNLIPKVMLPTAAPYITSLPVLVVPQSNDVYATNNALGSAQSDIYQTRQDSPSFPFQFQWPLASLFPILVKDPLLGFLHGGGWNNFFEIGQSADVCSRRQKSREAHKLENFISTDSPEINQPIDNTLGETNVKHHSRVARSVKNQNIPASPPGDAEGVKTSKKVILRPIITRKSTKKPQIDKEVLGTKGADNEGDLRFPFSDFTWFGNKKPVAPSPGFFINKMKVRRGGVAIAGPGGVATAGRGGTAIVGPGGLAYTQPGGVAVAGPAARVVALSPYTDLTSFVTRLHQQAADGSLPRSFNLPPEGRLVATGPVIYYHPYYAVGQAGPAAGPLRAGEPRGYHYDGMNFVNGTLTNSALIVHLSPKAEAIAGPRGTAIANPVSHVVVGAGKRVSVVHEPAASAVAGPGGVAHAQADLYLYEYTTDLEQ